VVASHDHYDHYDVQALAAYPDKAVPMVVKRGMGAKARAAGFTNVTELEPWEQATIGDVTITAAPARHGVPEITFILQGDAKTIFFGADTLRIPELDEVPRRFPSVDLALLPVNGLRIRPAFNHQVVMNAEQAAEYCAVLHPEVAVPIHYAFTAGPVRDRLLLGYDGTPARFREAAGQRAPDTVVRVLEPGEPLVLDGGGPVNPPTGGPE
jgi:L-ascorbate metabolism protein UlaG (beta-lactamase superfamily)